MSECLGDKRFFKELERYYTNLIKVLSIDDESKDFFIWTINDSNDYINSIRMFCRLVYNKDVDDLVIDELEYRNWLIDTYIEDEQFLTAIDRSLEFFKISSYNLKDKDKNSGD